MITVSKYYKNHLWRTIFKAQKKSNRTGDSDIAIQSHILTYNIMYMSSMKLLLLFQLLAYNIVKF